MSPEIKFRQKMLKPVRGNTMNDKYTLVKCVAEIRRNSTGEVRLYRTDEPIFEGDAEIYTFNWSDNNNSCDCNRRIFFNSVADIETPFGEECSDGLYSVNLYTASDGNYYYREFE